MLLNECLPVFLEDWRNISKLKQSFTDLKQTSREVFYFHQTSTLVKW